jgi:hypothetical protein
LNQERQEREQLFDQLLKEYLKRGSHKFLTGTGMSFEQHQEKVSVCLLLLYELKPNKKPCSHRIKVFLSNPK